MEGCSQGFLKARFSNPFEKFGCVKKITRIEMGTNEFKERVQFWVGVTGPVGLLFTIVSSIFILKKDDANGNLISIVLVLASTNVFLGVIASSSFVRQIKTHSSWMMSFKKIKKQEDDIENLKTNIDGQIILQEKLAKFFHNFSHEYRKIIVAIYYDLYRKDYSKFENRKNSYKQFILYTMENIKYIFDSITGDDCAVTVKVLRYGKIFDRIRHPDLNEIIPDSAKVFGGRDFLVNEQCYDDKKVLLAPEALLEGGVLISTYLRDPISYRRRNIADKILPYFPCRYNTAFSAILDDKNPVSFFLSNDLKSDEEEGTYINKSPNWNDCYNACLVVPIRYIECLTDIPANTKQAPLSGVSPPDETSIVLGFICVDNKLGRFQHPFATDTLASVGDHFYQLFLAYAELAKHKPQSATGDADKTELISE